jgi:hypothetical protein
MRSLSGSRAAHAVKISSNQRGRVAANARRAQIDAAASATTNAARGSGLLGVEDAMPHTNA